MMGVGGAQAILDGDTNRDGEYGEPSSNNQNNDDEYNYPGNNNNNNNENNNNPYNNQQQSSQSNYSNNDRDNIVGDNNMVIDMHGAEIHQQHQHGNDHEYVDDEDFSNDEMDDEYDDEDDETSGVIPRIIRDLFQSMSEAPTSLEYIVRCSYVEIYLEKVFDLLDPSSRSLTIVDGSTLLPLQQQLLTE